MWMIGKKLHRVAAGSQIAAAVLLEENYVRPRANKPMNTPAMTAPPKVRRVMASSSEANVPIRVAYSKVLIR
jgi:hypothetical protein